MPNDELNWCGCKASTSERIEMDDCRRTIRHLHGGAIVYVHVSEYVDSRPQSQRPRTLLDKEASAAHIARAPSVQHEHPGTNTDQETHVSSCYAYPRNQMRETPSGHGLKRLVQRAKRGPRSTRCAYVDARNSNYIQTGSTWTLGRYFNGSITYGSYAALRNRTGVTR